MTNEGCKTIRSFVATRDDCADHDDELQCGQCSNFPTEVESTPAEDSIGERLFLDTRFAQFFATHMTGVNQP